MDGKIVHNMPAQEYQDAIGINASLLADVDAHSLKYVRAVMNGMRKESREFDLGTAFHAALLEDDRRNYAIKPDGMSYATKEGKAWRAEHEGEMILSAEDDAAIDDMLLATMRACGEFCPMHGDAEVSLFATGPSGYDLKGRIDYLPKDGNAIVDIKTARNADPEAFVRQAWDLRYHMKAAFYLDLARKCGIERGVFRFIVVSTQPPHDVSVITMQDGPCSFISAGRQRYRQAFAKLTKAIETNTWPSYGSHHAEDFATAWMTRELELS